MQLKIILLYLWLINTINYVNAQENAPQEPRATTPPAGEGGGAPAEGGEPASAPPPPAEAGGGAPAEGGEPAPAPPPPGEGARNSSGGGGSADSGAKQDDEGKKRTLAPVPEAPKKWVASGLAVNAKSDGVPKFNDHDSTFTSLYPMVCGSTVRTQSGGGIARLD
ncbi:hypothetical protein KIN20_023146 [Parelaphostrongylus tenuis]|uniref:Uncharacterized protein n=1 Tax=Parelaphostrongylus tenuis TaxID=148309 RepID=A0AAD5MRA5_PARTN|nr:hypothetical protein KIN20_023146 [Parelaphostrongylus tenuis]